MDNPIYDDFRNFAWLVWQHLLGVPPTDVQYDMADWLQNGPNRRGLLAFRGAAKTWLTGTYAAWRLMKDPTIKVLISSASKPHADNIALFIMRLIDTIPELAHLDYSKQKRQARDGFDVGGIQPDVAPSVRSVGITGQKTGGRADLIIADDIETPENSMTHGMREKISEAVKEFDSIIKPEDDAEIIYLGTPQINQSLYNALPERGYKFRVWPARLPNRTQVLGYKGQLAPYITHLLKTQRPGTPVEPIRFDDEELLSREMSLGRSTFELQFMLNTASSDANRYPLKLKDFITMDLDPDMGPEAVIWASDPDLMVKDVPIVGLSGDYYVRPMRVQGDYLPYKYKLMVIDPSGRGKDETAYCVTALLNGNIFLLEIGGLTGGYDPATLTELARIAQRFGVNEVLIESNFGNGMFTELFQPILKGYHKGCAVEEVKVTGQKEKRIIDTLEPAMNQHKIVVNKSLIKKDIDSTKEYDTENKAAYQFFYQLTNITKDKGSLYKDDRVDCFSLAVNYWKEWVYQDQEEEIQRRKEELLDEELRQFYEGAGLNQRGPTSLTSYD